MPRRRDPVGKALAEVSLRVQHKGIPRFRSCSGCHVLREVPSDFYIDKRGTYGITRRCRRCHSKFSYESRAKNPQNFERDKARLVERKFGISMLQYEDMLLEQGGVCAICRTEGTHFPAVDHDHATGRVRALLCRNCNMGLGQFREDPRLLREAAAYLERHSEVV